MFFKRSINSIRNLITPRIYLDYASATPVDARMIRTFPKVSSCIVGVNPSALHKEGVEARRVIDSVRSRVANILHAHTDEIIFVSGATESDNIALLGTLNHWMKEGIEANQIAVVASELEHAAVTETLRTIPDIFRVVLPAPEGVVEIKGLQFGPHIKKVLISVMYVNNEIGTEQPIKDIAKAIRRIRKDRPDLEVVFHVDATQAPLYYNLRVDQLGVDLMTLGATKLYCHRGVGVLYKKRAIKLSPIMYGGGQERGLRPGTEPTELIHEFAHALSYAQERREEETARVRGLQQYFEEKIQTEIPEAIVTNINQPRTPHISHIAVKDFDSELLVIELDAKGIAVSAKSACKNEEDSESPIVEQLYGKGYGAVRFSFGRKTTKRQLNRAIKALKKVLEKYKRI